MRIFGPFFSVKIHAKKVDDKSTVVRCSCWVVGSESQREVTGGLRVHMEAALSATEFELFF